MSKTITLQLDNATYEEFREAAAAEGWPIANLIETAALLQIREQQCLDDAEMAELRADKGLLARLQAGSEDVRARVGRFVEESS